MVEGTPVAAGTKDLSQKIDWDEINGMRISLQANEDKVAVVEGRRPMFISFEDAAVALGYKPEDIHAPDERETQTTPVVASGKRS